MEARRSLGCSETERVVEPTYQVDFWERPKPGFAWNVDTWLLDGCKDVREAIGWAEANARGRRFQLLVLFDAGEGSQQTILLLGDNPNDPDDRPREASAAWGFTRAP